MGASQNRKSHEQGLKNHIMNLTTQCHILPDGKNILLEVDETSPNYIRPI